MKISWLISYGFKLKSIMNVYIYCSGVAEPLQRYYNYESTNVVLKYIETYADLLWVLMID